MGLHCSAQNAKQLLVLLLAVRQATCRLVGFGTDLDAQPLIQNSPLLAGRVVSTKEEQPVAGFVNFNLASCMQILMIFVICRLHPGASRIMHLFQGCCCISPDRQPRDVWTRHG